MFLRHRHSHNRHVQNVSFIEPEFFVLLSQFFLSLNTNNCSFWKLNNRFWQCNSIFTTTPSRYLYKKSSWYIRSELLTQWNAGCKTLNNDHYDNTYFLLFMFFSFMVDYIKFRLALAISFQGNFHMRCEASFIWTKLQWYNTFWNLVLTIVD